jgi:hypothetical protein
MKANNKTRRGMKTTWIVMRGVLATVWGVGWCQGQSLTVEVDLRGAPIQLQPNTADQKWVIWGYNPWPNEFDVMGMSLGFRVNGGGDVQHQPSITGLDVVSGTPWEGSALTLTPDDGLNRQFKGMDIFLTDFLEGAVVTIPTGSFRLAELTFDTTSLEGGSWTFALSGSDLEFNPDGYLVLASAAQATLVATLGSVTVVPEPMRATAATGLAVGLAGCWLVRRRRSGA